MSSIASFPTITNTRFAELNSKLFNVKIDKKSVAEWTSIAAFIGAFALNIILGTVQILTNYTLTKGSFALLILTHLTLATVSHFSLTELYPNTFEKRKESYKTHLIQCMALGALGLAIVK